MNTSDDAAFASDPPSSSTERHQREERCRSIFDDLPDTLVLLDAEGRIEEHNPALERLLGYPREELVRRPLADFFHPDDLTVATELIRDRLAAPPGSTATLEVRVQRRDRSWRRLSMAVATRAGSVPSLLVSGRDETERRLLQVQREQTSRINSLGRLAMTVAHDFSNVLMGIQPFAELMQRPGVDPKVSRAAGYIVSSIARGKDVVLDIVRFGQATEPVLAPLELASWWEELVPNLQAETKDDIRFEWSIPTGLTAMADANQLAQVLTNLVSNARDAMPGGGALRVEARRPERHETFAFGVVRDPDAFLQISVSDTGTGMDESSLLHAFDPLFTTKRSRRTGLGLAVVHQVVTRHGGAVFAVSEAGAGTTFHVFVPVAS